MSTRVLDTPCFELYQQMVDKIFGNGAITIKADKDNNVIGTLKYVDEFKEFRENFEKRLSRLKEKFEHTPSYDDLKQAVAQVADYRNWEGAFAELVTYDIFSNDYLPGNLVLNNTLAVGESFAGELGGKETNEDGFIEEYDLYFDVKILADTVGAILKSIIDEATKATGFEDICNIIPEYPLDDDDAEYQFFRRQIVDELKDFLVANKPKELKGRQLCVSKVLTNLSFRIQWGGGINSSTSAYNPYRHAEATRHLFFKRYAKKFMKSHPFMLVMVNFPWYNGRINSFADADEAYYRAIARRTFCEYKNLTDPMNSIVPKFNSGETVFEVSKHLSGIVFIDDFSITSDSYSCHIYLNPNANNPITYSIPYLMRVIEGGDNRGVLDDLKNDNY